MARAFLQERAARGQLRALRDRGEQAGRVGAAAPGQFQRGAVIDRHARVGQAQGQVHRLLEAAVLEHRQSLVVVHRQHRIDAGQFLRQERGVGRQRAEQAHAFAAQGVEDRHHHLDFLAAQMPVLAGMRIQPEHRDDRRGDAEVAAQRGVDDAQAAF
ncbi:hypothetical protein A6R71_07360 [Xanthomonas translucens pv. arrhenatheri]|nr:hypothetical protein A6R71_07360 [Xanthomonas translucens pv. arrhenatheri]